MPDPRQIRHFPAVEGRILKTEDSLAEGDEFETAGDLDGADRYPLNAVVAVAVVIPFGTLRLGVTRLIGRARSHVRRTCLVDASDELPPAPAAALRLSFEAGLLPTAFADADVDSRNRRDARPRHTPDGQFAATDFPLLIATDSKGIVRFIQPAPEDALDSGGFLDQVTAHIAAQWPPAH